MRNDLVAVTMLAVGIVAGCRSYSYVGIRCGDGGTCPAGLTCGAWRERPADGLFCVDAPSLLADAGGGASDGGGTSDAGADAGTADAGSVMLAIEVRSVPPGTTHITARIDRGITETTVDIPRVGDGGFVSVSVAPSPPNYRIRVVASHAPTAWMPPGIDAGHTAIATAVVVDAGLGASTNAVTVPLLAITHVARGTPASVPPFQFAPFDETLAIDPSFVTSSGTYYSSMTPFDDMIPMWPGTPAAPFAADAGQVRYVTDGWWFTYLGPGTSYYMLVAPIASELTMPGYNTYLRYPSADAGANGPTITVGDASATVRLVATNVSDGSTYVTAALLGGPTPNLSGTLFQSGDRWSATFYSVVLGPPNYTILISAAQVDDGGILRMRAAYASKNVAFNPGFNELSYPLFPIPRTARGTPACIVGSADASISYRESFDILPEFFADSGVMVIHRYIPFDNMGTGDVSAVMSVAASDAGGVEFSTGPTPVWSGGNHWYQIRAPVHPALRSTYTGPLVPSADAGPVFYFQDTQAGQSLDTFEWKVSCP